MTIPPKVRLVCGKPGCDRVLADLYAPADYTAAIVAARAATTVKEQAGQVQRVHCPPNDWSGNLRMRPCPKHGGARLPFAQEVLRLARQAGRTDFRPRATVLLIPWRDLAPAFRRAENSGRTLRELVNP